ncbi:hypothetical protein Tco_1221104 [Tanacetum coccineum]
MYVPVTAEEKTNKKNDVKARSLLLIALPNEHQLTFSQYLDAKTMFAAIETWFGVNEATKKTQNTLLKQQYENFSATSAESLDSIFNRLQNIVSRLAILGVFIAQEDLNSKILSSLPPNWNTHVVVWMNKPEVDTMSIDDLYNNFKIVEQKVKKYVGASSGAQNLAFMTALSTITTNDVNTASPQVSTASTNVNTASPQVSTASFRDNVVYAFMVENPNGSNLLHQDLEQIHEDDLEVMDLKWQLSLLSMRAKRPNDDALRKCILEGPYTPTIVTTPAVPATENSPTVPEQTTVKTFINITPENRAHFESEKEEVHLILTGIRDEIYSTVDACQTAQEMWEAIERLQQGESLNIQDVKTNLFWEFGQFTSHDGETIESYYTRFYKMMNEMIRNNLTVATMQVNVQFLQQLQPEWSRFVTIVKQQHKLDEVSYHKLFDILKQYQKEVNELRAERMAKNANPLALVATAQTLQDPYYQTSKPHKSYAPTSKASLPTRSHATTRHKGNEIAKPITPPSESASEEDSNPKQALKDKEMQKNLALIAKYFKKLYKPTTNNLRTSSNTRNKNVDTTPRYKNDNQSGYHFAKECRKPKRVKDSTYHKEKMLLCKQAEKGVQLQAEQSDWLADTDEEIDEQELEAHYSYMAKIQEVHYAHSGTDSEPLEQVQYDTGYNVFANEIQHSKQSESISNTCAVETGDSNVTPDSPDMCDNDIQDDQNDVECDDERVALANLKLDVDENKKIQKQLKKANATLTQELTECKSILAETSKTLRESNSIRDSCLVALQINKLSFEGSRPLIS